MEYIRLLQTGIMAEYPVMSTSQGANVQIEQTSEAIRVTNEMCSVCGGRGVLGARGLELRTAALELSLLHCTSCCDQVYRFLQKFTLFLTSIQKNIDSGTIEPEVLKC